MSLLGGLVAGGCHALIISLLSPAVNATPTVTGDAVFAYDAENDPLLHLLSQQREKDKES